jgi:transposase
MYRGFAYRNSHRILAPTGRHQTRRAALHQSNTLSVGMDGHQASIAVASVATAHDAEGLALGTFGPRHWDIAPRMRQLPAKAPHLVFVSAAGPCGSGRSRYRTKQDDGCWGGAPSGMPQKAGDRVTTDRRDARPLARRRRSGDLTPVSVPARDAAALRDLRRARADTLRALTAATRRRQALVRRHVSRSPGRAPWRPAHRRWRSEVGGCPHRSQHPLYSP